MNPTGPGNDGGSAFAGMNDATVPPTQGAANEMLQIVGATVWTSDNALVGVVTSHEAPDATGMVVVTVDVVDTFGMPRDTVRLKVFHTGFADGRLKVTQDKEGFMDLFV